MAAMASAAALRIPSPFSATTTTAAAAATQPASKTAINLSQNHSYSALLLKTSRETRKPTHILALSSPDVMTETAQTLAAGLDRTAFAVVGGGVIATLAAALSLADPEKRRQQQAAAARGDDKDVVRNYFNTAGFERWKKIYGETDDVNSVQLDIRQGHAETVQKVLELVKKEGSTLQGLTVCDAGCGTGSLAIPLAMEGAIVSASDISAAMVSEAEKRAKNVITEGSVKPRFETRDLESLEGKYHTVVCLDVLIHYPQEKMEGMIGHLASLAEKRLVLSFAPWTLYYSVLKRIGELFPGPSKATRAYLHSEEDVEAALKEAGWVVRTREMTATRFYFSRLLEAVPADATSSQ